MEVCVKEGMPPDFFGFYDDQMRFSGKEGEKGDAFTLVERTSSDKETTLTIDEQFSDKWMQCVNKSDQNRMDKKRDTLSLN